MNEWFRRLAVAVSSLAGKPQAFFVAVIIIGFWGASGPFFSFSNTWQLLINTATTIATFLMVFLIQNTQNRDSRAIHLKLDELIKGVQGARNLLINVEELSDEELEKLHAEAQEVHERYTKALRQRKKLTKL